MCFKKGCVSYRKSIRRDALEGEFTALLGEMQPSDSYLTLAKAMFTNAWDQRSARAGAVFSELKRETAKIDKQIEGLLERIIEASTPSVISAYEKRIAQMERKKLVIEEKLANGPKSRAIFDELFELAWEILSSPCKIFMAISRCAAWCSDWPLLSAWPTADAEGYKLNIYRYNSAC